MQKTKTCSDCKKKLPIENFSIRNKLKRQLYSYCRKCNSKKSMASYRKRVAPIEHTPTKVMPIIEFEKAFQAGAKA